MVSKELDEECVRKLLAESLSGQGWLVLACIPTLFYKSLSGILIIIKVVDCPLKANWVAPFPKSKKRWIR